MRELWVAVALLWLAGVGLRLTVLAVPPVIASIQADLNLSGTEIGILSGLPVILFGIAALPGALLIARVGAVRTLVAGLLVAGVASGLRGAVLDVWVLYIFTIVMSAGIAIMQPALPSLVRAWLPRRVSFGTALFTNGLLVGETLPVMLAPVVLPLVQDSWQLSMVFWGVPMLLIAALVMALAPAPKSPSAAAAASYSWWPDWSDKLLWQGALVVGSVNGVYFCSNAFLPGYLTEAGRADLISSALTALNFGQLPASFALLALASRFERRAWPLVLCGVLTLVCLLGVVTTASAWTVLFAGGLGFIAAAVLTLGLALPVLLSAPADVARISAAMFTIGYSEALVFSVLSGVAWDLGQSARFAFLPIALSALPLLFVPLTIRFDRRRDPAPR